MIISASRRTDIPAFHSEWMMRRLREGYALVRNPYNAHQVSKVSLCRKDAEAIVFWTKNAGPMLDCLDEMDGMGHRYLFQYTLTPYGADIEKELDKRAALDSMAKLCRRLGGGRVIWRYDPILLTDEWTVERHMKAFSQLAGRLEGAVQRCVVSFVDLYAGVKRTAPWVRAPGEEQMRDLARFIAQEARLRGMTPSACAEAIDLTGEGFEERGCIDRADIGALLGGCAAVRDSGQRGACRCIKSVDIGAYDTCGHGCVYCYARTSRGRAAGGGPDSPLLEGVLLENDRVTERKERRISAVQESFL